MDVDPPSHVKPPVKAWRLRRLQMPVMVTVFDCAAMPFAVESVVKYARLVQRTNYARDVATPRLLAQVTTFRRVVAVVNCSSVKLVRTSVCANRRFHLIVVGIQIPEVRGSLPNCSYDLLKIKHGW
jgi:hypothetical protein